jgi:hypothetical protein
MCFKMIEMLYKTSQDAHNDTCDEQFIFDFVLLG